LSRRAISTLIKRDYEGQKKKVSEFFVNIDKQIREKDIALIVNFDETAVFMEIESKSTLELKGGKYNGALSFGKTKERFTAVCAVASNGFKFPLIIILKTQSQNLEKIDEPTTLSNKKYSKECKDLINTTRTLVLQNKKAWNNAKLMRNYIIPHLLRYLPRKRKALVLMDNCSAHSCDDMLAFYNSIKLDYTFFPPDATSYLQPFDVSIARSFKSKIKNRFYTWVQDNYIEVQKEGQVKIKVNPPRKDEIIKWAVEAWEAISPEMALSSTSAYFSSHLITCRF
jgi:hypothetical protein